MRHNACFICISTYDRFLMCGEFRFLTLNSYSQSRDFHMLFQKLRSCQERYSVDYMSCCCKLKSNPVIITQGKSNHQLLILLTLRPPPTCYLHLDLFFVLRHVQQPGSYCDG